MASVEYLVIAGGGGGNGGGGSGAGGFLDGTGHAVSDGAYSITVGAGGPRETNDAKGEDSVFDTITAEGGGHNRGSTSQDGGSGGGGYNFTRPAGDGVPGQGFDGAEGDVSYRGGGGGGASEDGFTPSASATSGGRGGDGKASSISGESVIYAGGGGGYTNGLGGAGGGGNGRSAAGTDNGAANTGSGGGDLGGGGSGIVVIRYVTADFGSCTGGTITTDGGDTIHTFTSDGTFNVVTAGGIIKPNFVGFGGL